MTMHRRLATLVAFVVGLLVGLVLPAARAQTLQTVTGAPGPAPHVRGGGTGFVVEDSDRYASGDVMVLANGPNGPRWASPAPLPYRELRIGPNEALTELVVDLELRDGTHRVDRLPLQVEDSDP